MKKKILLLALVMTAFVFLLAIGISAADFESAYSSETATYGEGPDWAKLDDTYSTAVIKKADGTFVRIPAYYIFKANSSSSFEANGSNFDFSWISEQLDEKLTLANLVAIEVPNGTKGFSDAIRTSIFPALEELVVPTSITSFPQKFLRDNTVIKKVFIKQSMDANGNVQGATSLPSFFADMNTSGCVSSLEYFKFELDYVTSIGSGALSKSAIKEITLVGPLTSIGNAFGGCKSLKTVYINNTGATSVTIATQAFKDSPAITSITLNNVSLGNYLFENVNGAPGELTAIITNVGAIGTGAFKNVSNLSKIEISGSITSFGSGIFGGCHNLTDVTITNTSGTPVMGGTDTFNGLKVLKNVTLDGIQIDAKMFHKVKTLENLNLINYTIIGDYAFSESNIASFVVPNSITSVGAYAFQGCANLTSVTLGENITVIRNNTFQNCSKLEGIVIPAGISGIGDYAFQNCKALSTVTFAGNVSANAVIGYATFENCTALTSIAIPEGVTTLGNCAFKGSGLTSVSFPTTLTTLTGGQHFWNTKLETVTGFENTKITSVPDSMFRGLTNWKPDVLRIPDTVETIGQHGFADIGAKIIIIGTGLKTLGTEAFINCRAVEAFYIPNTITSFGGSALVNNVVQNICYFVASDNETYLNSVKSCAGAADVVALGTYEADKDLYAKGKHVISGCNPCTLFYEGTHSMAGDEFMTLNSYFETIIFSDKCTRDGCGKELVLSTINPIFVYKGYSCTEFAINGKHSMSQFFMVDATALKQYTDKTGTTLEFGLVVSVSNDPLAKENEGLIEENKTIIAPSSSFAHDYFFIGVNGIATDIQKEKAITFCAYVIDNGDVYYLDGGKTERTVTQKSYNDILNMSIR